MQKYEEVLHKAVRWGRYQTILSIIVITFSITGPFYLLVLPTMETPPQFKYDNGEIVIENDIEQFCGDIYFTQSAHETFKYLTLDPSNIRSWTFDLKIICNVRELISFIGTVFFLGSVTGILVLSKFPDRYGRQRTFLIINFITFISLFQLLFLYSYGQLIISAFLLGIASINMTIGSIFINEIIEKEHSGIIMGITNAMFPLGGIINTSALYLFGTWKIYLVTVLITSALCNILGLMYLVESPPWLLSNHHYKQFVSTIDYINHINKKPTLSEEHVNSKINGTSEISKDSSPFDSLSVETKLHNYEIIDLIRYKSIRYITLASFFLWFMSGFSFFGILLNLSGLTGNLYVDAVVTYSAEFIAEIGSGIAAQKYGGKNVLVFCFAMASIFSLLFCIISHFYIGVCFLFLSAVGIASIFNVLYIYTPQVYPTNIKSLAMNILVLSNRFAAGIVTIILTYTPRIMLLIGIGCGIGTIIMLSLPQSEGVSTEELDTTDSSIKKENQSETFNDMFNESY